MHFILEPLTEDNPAAIAATDGGAAWNADPSVWRAYFADQTHGLRKVLVAHSGTEVLGYGNLLLRSSYLPFRDAGIPEINNLVVAERARRNGIATRMIVAFEDLARAAGASEIGIGVGLYSDYGAAQRLYVKLGYVPDGRGVTYLDALVQPGTTQCVDDDLVLRLTKVL